MKALKPFLLALCLLLNAQIFAADTAEMADAFRADGKIYVVVAVISIVFIGLAFWLFRLDRKISRLEKNQKS